MIDTADAFLRVGAAGALGAVIGVERQSRNQLAGLRTHALVAVGAAVFTLAGAMGFPGLHRGPNVDPMRVAAQIASGIGFIGAGTIIRDRGAVRGITTAAALWTSAAVGLATGAGLWAIAGAGTLVTLVVLVLLRPVRAMLTLPAARYVLQIEYERGHGTLRPILEALAEAEAEVIDLAIDDRPDGSRQVTIEVETADAAALNTVARDLTARSEVAGCAVRPK